MFQSGDVDYLVATDAVGMGLNLDVDHVAFASDRKYDGYQFRRLNPSEFAQIAGRAGRATRDGTFGTTGRCAPFEPELVNALQNHTFESVKVLQWRNSKLDFSSLGALQVSLALTPTHEALTRAPIAEDLRVLDHAARDADVREMAVGAAAVERLWDACQIPDYRKIAPAAHAELVTTLFGFLMKRGASPTPGLPPRSTRPTAPTAISTRCRTGSRISGPGHLSQIVRIGWPTRSIGRESHAILKINCPMRCMNGSRSVSLTAVPVY